MTSDTVTWNDPILEDCPIGYDIRCDDRYQSRYRKIKDLRREARSLEKRRQLNEPVEHPRRIWKEIYTHCNEVLVTISKDYEIISWAIESSVYVFGFKGLVDVLVRATQCIQTFGLSMYPVLDDDEDESCKILSISGLNGEHSDGSLVNAIYRSPMTESGDVVFWECQEYMSEKDNGHIDRSKVESSLLSMTPEELKKLYGHVERSFSAYEQFSKALDDLYGDHAPGCSRIKQILSGVLDCVKQLMASRGVLASIANDSPLLLDENNDQNETVTTTGCALQTRTQALAQLKKVAQYFSDHEPHSPVPYMLERTIAWANMRLPELLAEMINNSQELTQVYTLTGIQSNNQNN